MIFDTQEHEKINKQN